MLVRLQTEANLPLMYQEPAAVIGRDHAAGMSRLDVRSQDQTGRMPTGRVCPLWVAKCSSKDCPSFCPPMIVEAAERVAEDDGRTGVDPPDAMQVGILVPAEAAVGPGPANAGAPLGL